MSKTKNVVWILDLVKSWHHWRIWVKIHCHIIKMECWANRNADVHSTSHILCNSPHLTHQIHWHGSFWPHSLQDTSSMPLELRSIIIRNRLCNPLALTDCPLYHISQFLSVTPLYSFPWVTKGMSNPWLSLVSLTLTNIWKTKQIHKSIIWSFLNPKSWPLDHWWGPLIASSCIRLSENNLAN